MTFPNFPKMEKPFMRSHMRIMAKAILKMHSNIFKKY